MANCGAYPFIAIRLYFLQHCDIHPHFGHTIFNRIAYHKKNGEHQDMG